MNVALGVKVFSTPRFDVYYSREGSRDYYFVQKPHAVLVVPILNDRIGLLRIERPIISRVSLELPGGRIEDSESPLHAAKRELREELGFESEHWSAAEIMYPLPSITNEMVYVFTVRIEPCDGARCSKGNQVEGIVAFEWFSKEQVCAAIRDCQVVSAVDAYALMRSMFLPYKPGDFVEVV